MNRLPGRFQTVAIVLLFYTALPLEFRLGRGVLLATVDEEGPEQDGRHRWQEPRAELGRDSKGLTEKDGRNNDDASPLQPWSPSEQQVRVQIFADQNRGQ